MAISKKLGEADVYDAVTYVLLENGSLNTSEVKKRFANYWNRRAPTGHLC